MQQVCFDEISVSGETAMPTLFSKKSRQNNVCTVSKQIPECQCNRTRKEESAPKKVHQLSDFLFTSVSCHFLAAIFSTAYLLEIFFVKSQRSVLRFLVLTSFLKLSALCQSRFPSVNAIGKAGRRSAPKGVHQRQYYRVPNYNRVLQDNSCYCHTMTKHTVTRACSP